MQHWSTIINAVGSLLGLTAAVVSLIAATRSRDQR